MAFVVLPATGPFDTPTTSTLPLPHSVHHHANQHHFLFPFSPPLTTQQHHSIQRNGAGSVRCLPISAVQRPTVRRHSTLVHNHRLSTIGVPVFRPLAAGEFLPSTISSMPPPPSHNNHQQNQPKITTPRIEEAVQAQGSEATVQMADVGLLLFLWDFWWPLLRAISVGTSLTMSRHPPPQPLINKADDSPAVQSKWSSNGSSGERQSSAQFSASQFIAAQPQQPRIESPTGTSIRHIPPPPQMIPPGAVMIYEQPTLEQLQVPYWYPMPPPMPVYLPPHAAAPLFAPPLPTKKQRQHSNEGSCEQLCCSGVAQLLWTIITIVLMGILAALVLALFVV